MLHQWESVAGNLELTTKLNTEIGHHKEYKGWRFEHYPLSERLEKIQNWSEQSL